MQLTIIGRYKNTNDLKNITLRLTGKAGKAARSFAYKDLDFPIRADENDFLPRLWASRRVGWLLEQIRSNGETKEVRDEVVDLGTRYGLVTPYTSYLATDGTLTTVRREAPMAADLGRAAAKRVQERSGADAVGLSVQQNAMQSNTFAVATEDKDDRQQIIVRNSVNNQFVANKNFINQNGVWIDSEYSDSTRLPEVKLQFASDEYFRIIEANRELAPYLALGEQVVFVWNGKVYRITR
jgi:Ca-activated chloride channel family protein